MILLCILTNIFTLTLSFFCQTPQRIGYMSYSTLIDYDNLTGLFQKIDNEFSKFQCVNNTVDSNNYSLKNIQPHIYYYDSKQNISFLDIYRANVTGGKLAISFIFDYEIQYQNGSTLKGKAKTLNYIDDFWFSKALTNQRGQLLWKVDITNPLVLRDPIFIETSDPKLPFNDKLQIQSLINGDDGGCKAKQHLTNQLNTLYKSDLQNWLINQPLMTSTNIVYNYSSKKSIQYINHPYQFGLNQHGLVYQFLFQVENYTNQCVELNTTFQKSYGGNQQIISMPLLKATATKALDSGWFNVDLGNNWEIPQFQYYMGDLGNYIDKAKNHTPSQLFDVSCKWDNSLYDVSIEKQQNNQLYVTVPYVCNFKVNGTDMQKLSLYVGMIITMTATRQYLVLTISPKTGVLSPVFTQLNGYKITSYDYATQCLKRVIASTIGSRTLGTGFPINSRGRPAVVVQDLYVLIYDASQPY